MMKLKLNLETVNTLMLLVVLVLCAVLVSRNRSEGFSLGTSLGYSAAGIDRRGSPSRQDTNINYDDQDYGDGRKNEYGDLGRGDTDFGEKEQRTRMRGQKVERKMGGGGTVPDNATIKQDIEMQKGGALWGIDVRERR